MPAGRIQEQSSSTFQLDVKDRKILHLLLENSRMPASLIAKKVLLSRDGVQYRIRRLQEQGVIIRFFPVVDYRLLGFNVYHVFFVLDERHKELCTAFLEALKTHPNILSVMEYNDRWDLQISLLARTSWDFDELLMQITSPYAAAILEKSILEHVHTYKLQFFPLEQASSFSYSTGVFTPLDAKDFLILQYLTEDARQSTYDIGKKVKLDADTVSYRIKRLGKSGLLKQFTTLINFSKLGYHWFTCGVQMKTFDHAHAKKFEQYTRGVPQIIRAIKIIGSFDLLLYIVVEQTKQFHQILKELRATFFDVFKGYDTWNAYEEHVYNTLPAVLAEAFSKK